MQLYLTEATPLEPVMQSHDASVGAPFFSPGRRRLAPPVRPVPALLTFRKAQLPVQKDTHHDRCIFSQAPRRAATSRANRSFGARHAVSRRQCLYPLSLPGRRLAPPARSDTVPLTPQKARLPVRQGTRHDSGAPLPMSQ